MKIIDHSAEHHLLTFVDKMRHDSVAWLGLYIGLSGRLAHDDIIADPSAIYGKLHRWRQESDRALAFLQPLFSDLDGVILYRFTDFNVIALLRGVTDTHYRIVTEAEKKAVKEYGADIVRIYNTDTDHYSFQLLVDERYAAAGRIYAYKAMADANRIISLPLRRRRRVDPVVMIVEDDRFTASYAANLLNKQYDVVLAKDGADAVRLYIEHAPDIVFMDIHLPALDGHQALRAIRKIDPQAFVIMLSVDTVKENIVAANRNGAAGFLKKPFSKDRLMATVRKSPFIRQKSR